MIAAVTTSLSELTFAAPLTEKKAVVKLEDIQQNKRSRENPIQPAKREQRCDVTKKEGGGLFSYEPSKTVDLSA